MAAYDINADRAACEGLIRAQIRQVLLAAGVWDLPLGTAARLDAAMTRIADAWAADAERSYNEGSDYGYGIAIEPGYPLGCAIDAPTDGS